MIENMSLGEALEIGQVLALSPTILANLFHCLFDITLEGLSLTSMALFGLSTVAINLLHVVEA